MASAPQSGTSRSKTIIEIVKLVNSLQKQQTIAPDHIELLSKLTRTPMPNINPGNFHTVARHFIINGLRSNKGCRMIVTPDQFKIYGSPLNFILNKPVEFFNDYEPFEGLMPSMSHYASRKINAAYECLNPGQKIAFVQIHKNITDSLAPVNDGEYTINTNQKVYPIEKSFFATVNSRSGTGKSTIMGVMGCSLLTPMLFVVYSNALKEAAANLHPNITALTTCSFTMKTLGVNYSVAKSCFDQNQNRSLCCIFTRLFRMVKSFKLPVLEDLAVPYLIVVDETTTMSPYMILHLHMVSRYHKLNLLMVGDANQQKAIRSTVYHKMHNMVLLNDLSHFSISLTKQMRIEDAEYLSIINEIERCLDENSDNVKMEFNHKYKLYSLMTGNFHTSECPTAMFIASTHSKVKERIQRCFRCVPSESVVRAEYCRRFSQCKFIPVKLPTNYKFAPVLVLIPGYSYIRYSETSKNEDVVKFIRRIDENTLLVENSAGKPEKLTRIAINNTNSIDELYMWLTKFGAKYQFPLRFFTSTYYSAQGLTLDTCDLELDLDDTTMNAVYVGLTRIRQGSRLKRLHTRELHSLAMTAVTDDEFYYKLPDNIEMPDISGTLQDKIDQFHNFLYEKYKNIKFTLVQPDTFRSSRAKCVKVHRSQFDEYIKRFQATRSPLMEAYNRIKHDDVETLSSLDIEVLHEKLGCECKLDWMELEMRNDDECQEGGSAGTPPIMKLDVVQKMQKFIKDV